MKQTARRTISRLQISSSSLLDHVSLHFVARTLISGSEFDLHGAIAVHVLDSSSECLLLHLRRATATAADSAESMVALVNHLHRRTAVTVTIAADS